MGQEDGRQPPNESSWLPQTVEKLVPFLEDWFMNNGASDAVEAQVLRRMVKNFIADGNDECARCVKEFAVAKKMPVELNLL